MNRKEYEFETKTRLSDIKIDPKSCLRDEYGHKCDILWPISEISDDNIKLLLGRRIRILRLYRDMTQEEAATKAGINTALWRHYEHGMKMPRQDRLEKIAEVLSVPVQMLQPIDTHSPAGIASVLYNMRMQYGEVDIVELDGETYIKVPKNKETKTTLATINEIKQRLDKITFEEAFKYYCREEKGYVEKEIRGMSSEQIKALEECAEGKLPESELSLGDASLAEFIAETQYLMKNWKLMEYITELYKKQVI